MFFAVTWGHNVFPRGGGPGCTRVFFFACFSPGGFLGGVALCRVFHPLSPSPTCGCVGRSGRSRAVRADVIGPRRLTMFPTWFTAVCLPTLLYATGVSYIGSKRSSLRLVPPFTIHPSTQSPFCVFCFVWRVSCGVLHASGGLRGGLVGRGWGQHGVKRDSLVVVLRECRPQQERVRRLPTDPNVKCAVSTFGTQKER